MQIPENVQINQYIESSPYIPYAINLGGGGGYSMFLNKFIKLFKTAKIVTRF